MAGTFCAGSVNDGFPGAARAGITEDPAGVELRPCAQSWLEGIEEATAVLLRQKTVQDQPQDKSIRRRDRSSFHEEVDASLGYLLILQRRLEEKEKYWDQPPLHPPPEFHPHPEPCGERTSYDEDQSPLGSNPYATFYQDDDSEQEQDTAVEDDFPVEETLLSSDASITMRRILIRVVTALSELHACRAGQHRHARPPEWRLGAQTYETSLANIHHALALADSEYARLEASGEECQKASLRRDAEIVVVAIQYLTDQTDKYRHAAKLQEVHLLKKLEPQWLSRDEVKARMGDRWTYNPHPRNDYRRLRIEDERQLKEVRATLRDLDSLDMASAFQSSKLLVNRLSSCASGGRQPQPDERHNGQRAHYSSRRVPVKDYPDPTRFGWTFTGSWGDNVEFFENEDGIKLDFYFLTGTINLSADDHDQGNIQLFGGIVPPDVYQQMLTNPRLYTEPSAH